MGPNSSSTCSSEMSYDEEVLNILPAPRIPPFWKTNPVVWFAVMESIFNRAGVTNSQSKYDIVLPIIDTGVLEQMTDLLTCRGDNPYEILKQRIVQLPGSSNTERSKEKRSVKVKPSQMLDRIKEVVGDTVREDTVLAVWLQMLPERIQQAVRPYKRRRSLEKLAACADKLAELPPTDGDVKPTTSAPDNQLARQLSKLSLKVTDLQRQIDGMKTKRPTTWREPETKKEPASSTSCFYHDRFATDRQAAVHCTLQAGGAIHTTLFDLYSTFESNPTTDQPLQFSITMPLTLGVRLTENLLILQELFVTVHHSDIYYDPNNAAEDGDLPKPFWTNMLVSRDDIPSRHDPGQQYSNRLNIYVDDTAAEKI
ncbi:hypothetical protein AAG570_006972 [Ranatra chinensis]|uniref:DUF7041 domain-containing protein n=1 Tax=Ranatra chinensis TaxID=642074 RepID=A0ABD0YVK6_9HEMI